MSDAEKRPQAVALRYAQGDRAPKIVATGAGEIARRIVKLAEENNVPVRRNDSLAEVLGNLKIGYEIPPETYRAVAEILAFLYRTNSDWRKAKEKTNPLFSKGS